MPEGVIALDSLEGGAGGTQTPCGPSRTACRWTAASGRHFFKYFLIRISYDARLFSGIQARLRTSRTRNTNPP